MQGLYIVALLTLIMNVELLFIPPSIFFQHITPFLMAYMLSYIVLAPLLLKFFRTLFITYRMVDMLSFWKYTAWIPVSLILYSAILAHTNEPIAREYLIPRVLQALFGICIAITMYLGTRKMHYAIELKRENAALLTQMEMFADYTRMLQSAQRRMSIYRHDTRHQLRLLSKLIQEKDDTASLALLKTLTQELAQAAARLVNAAIAVSRSQDKSKQSITIIARQTETTIMLLIGNRQTGPVLMDAEGHPQNGPYAEVIPALHQFIINHQGVGRYTCKKGWVIANVRIPCKGGAAV